MDVRVHDNHSKNQKFRCTACGEFIRIYEDMQTAILPPFQEKTDKNNKQLENGAFEKVLIVDDSPMIRHAIRDILESKRSLKVVGEAANGVEALNLIPRFDPDVITMDINMPIMDGLTTLKHMMIKHPKPVVMISTLTREGASITFDALKLGAVDFITKPSRLNEKQLEKQREGIVQKVSMAAHVEIGEIRYLRSNAGVISGHEKSNGSVKSILTLGASEGGYSALLKIVPLLKASVSTAVLVVLYTSESVYVDAFTQYLDLHSMIHVKRAANHERLMGATCYVASGNEYLTLEKNQGNIFMQVNANPFPDRRGAINMMMISAAEKFGKNTIGAVLSGAGNDGVEGLREILRQGGMGLVQDPATCLCKDMAISVMKNLHIDGVLPDRKMANELNRVLNFNHSIN